MVDWREKAREEAIEDIVPNNLDNNESQNPEVISDDEDHEDEVYLELTSQVLQHLDQLLEFSLVKNDVRLSGLLSEVINTVKKIKISSLRQSKKSFFQEVLSDILLFSLSFFLNI